MSSAVAARAAARQILDEGRFHAASVPRPLHAVLHAIGTALTPIPRAIGRALAAVAAAAPGGPHVGWSLLAALALAAAIALTVRVAHRSLRVPPAGEALAVGPAPRAAQLEAEALAAERDGRHGDGVRLRFQAGLLRLAERELIPGAVAVHNAEVSRALRSERFDELARRFEEIVYGGRPAAAEDLREAREGWRQLLAGGARG